MSVTIDSELLKFDEKLSGAIGTISSGLTTLTSKLNDLKSSNTSFSNEVSSNYSGAGKDQAISSFTSLNSVVDAISGTFAEGPLKVVEESNDLLSKISDLKKLKEDIDKLESDISKLGGRWSKGGSRTDAEVDAHNNEISNLESQKSTKETEFNTKQTEAKTKLAAIKAINPEIKISKPADIAAEVNGQIMNDIKNLAPGTYTMKTFTASNGQRITYGIYVPANASTTTGLPLHLYMTGSGEVGNVNGNSLPMLLKKGQQSSGIVVALQANSGSSYTDPKYLTAAKELSDNVVKTYNVDPKRISISGHSLGGAGCLHMAEKYPGYFSVVAPVCGYNSNRGKQSGGAQQGYANLSKVKIVAVNGTSDTNSYNSIKGLYGQIKGYGNMIIVPIQGGHTIQNGVYSKTITINGKSYTNLLEYCLSQTRA